MKKTANKTKVEKDGDGVFDVAKPGKTTPDSSSRPLIVGNRTMLKRDPMVSPTPPAVASDTLNPKKEEAVLTAPELPDDKDKADEDRKSAVKVIKIEPHDAQDPNEIIAAVVTPKKPKQMVPIKLQPSAEADPVPKESPSPQMEDVKRSASKPEEPPADEPAPQDVPTTSSANMPEDTDNTTEKTEPTEDSSNTGSEDGAVGAVADQATTKKAADKAAAEAIAKKVIYEKLINEKKYFVSVGEKKRKRSMRFGLLLIVAAIVLALALGDLLIDAGIIKTSLKAPVSIFKQK